MIDSLIGKKISMTQIFTDEGRLVPVTVVYAGPCAVVQVKDAEKHGYQAVQLGFEEKRKNVSKPLRGHFEKSGVKPMRVLREVRVDGKCELKPGDTVGADIFEGVRFVHVTGITKGKGFQGTVKRHHKTRGPESHGSMNVRQPGSIGSSAFPSRVMKGMRMSGHMGHVRCTVKNLEVVKIDKESNLILLKGSVPGPNGGHILIRKAKAKRIKADKK
jgi:large subunit ribosomal protein L3